MRRLFLICVVLWVYTTTVVSAQQSPIHPDLVAGGNRFAFDLYRALEDKSDDNLIYSPYSMALALGMTYTGARGDTAQQMADVLGFLPQDQLPAAVAALNAELALRAEPVENMEGDPLRLTIANALWGQEGFAFWQDFLDLLSRDFAAPLNLVDFVSAPEASRETINAWVADRTEDRIPELIPAGALDSLTRLVLTNAIYFNASWQTAFDATLTQDATFTTLDGTAVTVPLMSRQGSMSVLVAGDYQAVELPYLGGSVSMLAILPENFDDFEAALTAEVFDAIRSGLVMGEVSLVFPRFETEADFELSDTLSEMGMPLAFSDSADFSGMADEPLSISRVIHQSNITLDETGTEAAAATAVIMEVRGALPSEDPVELRFDRPFIYVIYDRPTGAILFVGRVIDPGA